VRPHICARESLRTCTYGRCSTVCKKNLIRYLTMDLGSSLNRVRALPKQEALPLQRRKSLVAVTSPVEGFGREESGLTVDSSPYSFMRQLRIQPPNIQFIMCFSMARLSWCAEWRPNYTQLLSDSRTPASTNAESLSDPTPAVVV